ncbi:MAG: sigma-70 family RNA polymerase sigma factor [Bacteroidota bacterium]
MFFRLHKDPSPLSDSELIKKYLTTDDSYYVGELLQRYTHLIFGVCMKYLKNEADSEDGVMEIFEKLLTDLKQHKVENFKGWLYSVTKNHCLMKLRKQKRLSEKEPLDILYPESMEFPEDLHLNDSIVKEMQLNNLEKALTKLSKEQRQCVELFYLQEKCYKEVAEETNYSLMQVKSFIQNGKRNLRKYLEHNFVK